ncbi:MAG TPA: flagellar protein FlaG [Verrucomicrobiae bacterium]|nr:flagellar protein FlaG [Verrucomicrobiae bacterium]
MGIGPVHRVDMESSGTQSNESGVTLWQILQAVRALNRSEMQGTRRELRMRRLATGRILIELFDRDTGEVLGELPPGEVVQMAAQLHHPEAPEE